jgi:hypothetical protein
MARIGAISGHLAQQSPMLSSAGRTATFEHSRIMSQLEKNLLVLAITSGSEQPRYDNTSMGDERSFGEQQTAQENVT